MLRTISYQELTQTKKQHLHAVWWTMILKKPYRHKVFW
jgi:hypothetical protein